MIGASIHPHIVLPGLSEAQVEDARAAAGWNELPEHKKSVLMMFFRQFGNAMVLILLSATAVSLLVPFLHNGEIHTEEYINAVVILSIVILNAALGFFQERKAESSIALLKKLTAPHATVRRNGEIKIIPSRELVPGDVVILETGDRVPADGILRHVSCLEIDESPLTGESLPCTKRAKKMGEASDTSERVFGGTTVLKGSGEYEVKAIGRSTEIGKIAMMVQQLESPPTPLQLQLAALGKRIGLIVGGLCCIVFLIGIFKGLVPLEVFLIAISLAVAAVPEGLPAVVTICLSLGVERMIFRKALVRRLDAVETLGSITVICSDKTGTITQNRMSVEKVWCATGVERGHLLEAAASCNRAVLPSIGDPTELALLVAAERLNIERLVLDEEVVPFTSEAKYMATRHIVDGNNVVYAKGAPEVIAKLAKSDSSDLLVENVTLASQGMRVIAVAEDTGNGFRILGAIGLIDPPREGVKEAIALAASAGVRTIMITGDNGLTALHIARSVGIQTDGVIEGTALDRMDIEELQHTLKTMSVFARVQPAHKVKILEALQAQGHVVAMSGDGVNDAPALKRAHVGVAMGEKGTDTARDAAAIVLTDDNYATIVAAIEEGRRIYENIRKFVIFLLRSNIGEVVVVTGALFLNLPLPLLPLYILWINLVTDSFPALALALEPGSKKLMLRPPRKQSENILSGELQLLCCSGIISGTLVLGVFIFLLRTNGDLVLARTAALTTLIMFQLFLAFSSRTRDFAISSQVLKNPWLVRSVLFSFLLHILLLNTPLAGIFGVVPLSGHLWLLIIIIAFIAFLLFELFKFLVKKK